MLWETLIWHPVHFQVWEDLYEIVSPRLLTYLTPTIPSLNLQPRGRETAVPRHIDDATWRRIHRHKVVHKKPCATGRMISFHSAHPTHQKINTAKNFTHRASQLTKPDDTKWIVDAILEGARMFNTPKDWFKVGYEKRSDFEHNPNRSDHQQPLRWRKIYISMLFDVGWWMGCRLAKFINDVNIIKGDHQTDVRFYTRKFPLVRKILSMMTT